MKHVYTKSQFIGYDLFFWCHWYSESIFAFLTWMVKLSKIGKISKKLEKSNNSGIWKNIERGLRASSGSNNVLNAWKLFVLVAVLLSLRGPFGFYYSKLFFKTKDTNTWRNLIMLKQILDRSTFTNILSIIRKRWSVLLSCLFSCLRAKKICWHNLWLSLSMYQIRCWFIIFINCPT